MTDPEAGEPRSGFQRLACEQLFHQLIRNGCRFFCTLWIFWMGSVGATGQEPLPVFRLAHFSADVTIPLNHRCMGVLPVKSKTIADRLYAHGFVLLSEEDPIVFCGVDWCEIRNGSYNQWRTALAQAAETRPERVLLASLHQHDAPVVDEDAQQLLDSVGLKNELFDRVFEQDCLRRICKLMKTSLTDAKRVTHVGIGQARVDRIASNRRIRNRAGSISFSRGSASGGNPDLASAPVGKIDPYLKTISFWNAGEPVLAMHSYATHPMSYYGRGEISADFVGLARLKLQRDKKSVKQIYFSGCSGDVTAGKYNNGSPEMRRQLTDRLYRAMVESWKSTEKYPLSTIRMMNREIQLPFHQKKSLTEAALRASLENPSKSTESRILAAMGLASLNRVNRRLPIDLPLVDLGKAKILLFPGESFVGYQLLAQKLAPRDSFIFSIGYGECWPGYIPTEDEFADGFEDNWLWAGKGSQQVIEEAIKDLYKQPD